MGRGDPRPQIHTHPPVGTQCKIPRKHTHLPRPNPPCDRTFSTTRAGALEGLLTVDGDIEGQSSLAARLDAAVTRLLKRREVQAVAGCHGDETDAPG